MSSPSVNKKYMKLQRGWESYVMKALMPKFLEKFPITGKSPTNIEVSRFLVDNKWEQTIMKHTWNSALSNGMDPIPFDDFKKSLLKYKTYDGKVINAWKNSYVYPMGRKMNQSMKPPTRILKQRLSKIDKTKDAKYLQGVFKTVEGTSAQKAMFRKGTDIAGMKKVLNTSIIDKQYTDVVKSTFKRTNQYQGARLAQDQYQRVQADRIMKTKAEDIKEDLILEGVWKLSPIHEEHYYPDGEDPCEVNADIKYFYGDNIPIPVSDSHFGCNCTVETRVIPISQMKN